MEKFNTRFNRMFNKILDSSLYTTNETRPRSSPLGRREMKQDPRAWERPYRNSQQVPLSATLREAQAAVTDFLPRTISSNEGSGLMSGASNLADSSVVSTSAGSSLISSALDGSGSHTSSPMSRPRSS
jgi:hypothetical protein